MECVLAHQGVGWLQLIESKARPPVGIERLTGFGVDHHGSTALHPGVFAALQAKSCVCLGLRFAWSGGRRIKGLGLDAMNRCEEELLFRHYQRRAELLAD